MDTDGTLGFLLQDAPVLTGGAWGTLLQARGLDFGGCPDACNIAYPKVICEIASEYAKAGSWILLTNTFQANRVALARYGLSDRVGEINRTSVAMAQRGVGNLSFIFGSIGPIGGTGRSEAELRDIFYDQADAQTEGKLGGFVIETVTNGAELRAALAAVRDFHLPVVASITLGIGPTPDRLLSGETLEEAAQMAEEGGADVFGLNCMEAAQMHSYLPRLRASTGLPLWLKPNLGYPHLFEGVATYEMTANEFAEQASVLVAGGAAFIGGCCGSTPAHIRALALRYHDWWGRAMEESLYGT